MAADSLTPADLVPTPTIRRSSTPSIWAGVVVTWAGRVGLAIVGLVLIGTTFAPWFSPYDPTLMSLGDSFQSPSLLHPLGTDQMGRDVLTRMLYGGRLSLLVGVGTVLLGIVLGAPIGLIAGAGSPRLDAFLMRIMDILLAMPALILAMAVIAVLGAGVVNIIIAIGIRAVPVYARIARAEVLVAMTRDFVVAAEALGAPRSRILLRHVLPNILGPIIAISGLRIATAMLTAASLTFLGLGLPPGEPEWGVMVNEAKQYLRTHPHLIAYPGLMIMVAILGFNLLGDVLHDMLNPRLRAKMGNRGLA